MNQLLQIVNHSSHEVDVHQLVTVCRKYVHDIAHEWGEYVWHIVDASRANGFTLAIVDSLDVADALGYHDEAGGTPYALIGADACAQYGVSISSVVTHELAEMIGDPLANQWVDDGSGLLHARELCDAVESNSYLIDGLEVSDWVYPSYFNPFGTAPYDHCTAVSRPFEVTVGGYEIWMREGKVGQTFGGGVPLDKVEAKLARRPSERAYKRGVR